MKKTIIILGILACLIIGVIFICLKVDISRFGLKKKSAGVPIALEQDLAPEGFTYDGEYFWTSHEPGWEVDDEVKPGHSGFQAYIFKHTNDENLTAIKKYDVPHHYNVIGMVFINGDLWTSSWIDSHLGRIYQFEIEDDQLVEIGSWDTELACDGLAWDGSNLWCNMGQNIGIVKFNIQGGLKEIKRFPPPPELKSLKEDEINPKGLAWDGKNLWSTYKETSPLIVKHEMDELLSFVTGYPYQDDLLNFHPGGLAFANGVLYTSSSDPGAGNLRGGRIVKHKMDENLSIEKIYYYNQWK